MTAKIFASEFKSLKKYYKPTKYPIVLCHGLMGFDAIELPTGTKLTYFNGIREKLEQRGCKVVSMPVPPMASIQNRAVQLQSQIREQPLVKSAQKINIIAHSMGGLDARFFVSQLNKDFDVKSLTTLCTPHRGTTIADIFKPFTKKLPSGYGAFYQLTTDYMKQFNREIGDNPTTKYFSYGARIKPQILNPFYLTNTILQQTEGDNDGMVSVEAAKWGEYMGTMDKVDHADVINMNMYKPKRIVNADYSSEAMYMYIMNDLANRGY